MNINELKCKYSRSAVLRKAEGDNVAGFRNVIATENPAVVMDWYKWEPIREILLMDGVVLPENKQLPLMNNHNLYDIDDVIGSTRNIEVVGTELVGYTFVDKTETKALSLVEDGHLTDTSIGYQVFDNHTTILKPGEVAVINGREFKNDYNDGLDLYIRSMWKPFENSLTPVGADDQAKLRSQVASELENEKRNKQEIEITRKQTLETNKMSERTQEEILKGERERVDQIIDWSKRKSVSADQAIKEGWSVERFKGHILENMPENSTLEAPKTDIGLSAKEVRQYSIVKALRSAVNPKSKEAEFENEVSEEIAKRLGRAAKGLFVPYEIQRAMLASSTDNGAKMVATDKGEFIDLKLNKITALNRGAKFLRGLNGNLEFAKKTSRTTFAWKETETTAADSVDVGIGSIVMSPKMATAGVDIGRSLLNQSSYDVEQIVRQDIFDAYQLGIDKAVYHGTGLNGQPKGIAATSGIGAVTITAFEWATAIEFETKADVANCLVGNAAYVTTPAIRGTLKGTPKVGTFPMFIVGEDGRMNGYEAITSNQINTGCIFFGDHSEVIIGEWGVLDLIVDEISAARNRLVKLTLNVDLDVALRYPGAFAYGASFALKA